VSPGPTVGRLLQATTRRQSDL